MSGKQCKQFKCTYEPNAADCVYCQFDAVCPHSGTCSGCLFGIASDFIGCPERPLTNFSRISAHKSVENGCMEKIKLDGMNVEGL